MGAAVGLADIVREGENLLRITVVVLNCDFKELIVPLAVLKVNGLFKQNVLTLVYILYKVYYAALVAEIVVAFLFTAEVCKRELQTLVEVRKLP